MPRIPRSSALPPAVSEALEPLVARLLASAPALKQTFAEALAEVLVQTLSRVLAKATTSLLAFARARLGALARALFAIALVLGIGAPALATDPADAATSATLTVGVAPILDGDVGEARRKAIDRALEAALEQRLGFTLEAQRESSGHALVADRLRRTTRGQIASYEVVRETADDHQVTVEVRALLPADLLREQGVDRLHLAIVPTTPAGNDSTSARAVRDFLQTDLAARTLTIVPAAPDLQWDSPADAVQAAASAHDLDLVLLLDATTRRKNAIAGMELWEATVRARLLKGRTARVLWQMERTADGDRSGDATKARASALARAQADFPDALVDALGRSPAALVSTVVEVTDVQSPEQVDRILSHLKAAKGVDYIETAGMARGTATYFVEATPAAAKTLANTLRSTPGLDLNVGPSYGFYVLGRLEVPQPTPTPAPTTTPSPTPDH